ncbi:MAG: L-amino acid N-acyltransferase [Burkholderiales bacterium]
MRLTMLASVPKVFAAIARNRRCGRQIAPFHPATRGRYVVEAFTRGDLSALNKLYGSLTGGAGLGFQTTAVLWLLGSRLCLVARDMERNELTGMAIYYFNRRDRREGTIHEGYIGLHETARNAGLGTFMRRHALENFARSGLYGVSSRISVSNLPSLKSNQKLGFVPVETYFDPAMGDRRHYLICDLNLFRKPVFEQHESVSR